MGSLKNEKYYDTIYEKSIEYSKPYDKSVYYGLWKKVMSLITKQPILEGGCGPGQFAKMLEDNSFKDYIGFDFSEQAIKMAKKNSNQIFSVMDALLGKWPQYHFNTILLLEILEHTDDLKILSLVPIGKEIILTVPNFDCDSHIRHFTTIDSVISRYGPYMDIIHAENFNSNASTWYIIKGIKREM